MLTRFECIGELSIVRIYRPAHVPLCILQLSNNEFWIDLRSAFQESMKRIYALLGVAKVANIHLFYKGIYSGDIQSLEVDHKIKPVYFGNNFITIWPCHFLLPIAVYVFRSNPGSAVTKTPLPFSECFSMQMDSFWKKVRHLSFI